MVLLLVGLRDRPRAPASGGGGKAGPGSWGIGFMRGLLGAPAADAWATLLMRLPTDVSAGLSKWTQWNTWKKIKFDKMLEYQDDNVY